jgi:hypothetical protein
MNDFERGFNDELEKISLNMATAGSALKHVGGGAALGGLGGAALGAGLGYMSGDTPEEKKRRALMGGLGGAAVGGLAGGAGGYGYGKYTKAF